MKIIDELAKLGKISDLQLRAINALDINDNSTNIEELLSTYSISAEDILTARASAYNLDIVQNVKISPEVINKLPLEYIKENKILPLSINNGSLDFALVYPEHNNILESLKFEMLKLGMPYKLHLVREIDFQKAFKENYEKIVQNQQTQQITNNSNDLNNPKATITEGQNLLRPEQNIKPDIKPIVPMSSNMVGLVDQALHPENDKSNQFANEKAKEEIFSEESLLDISNNDGDLSRLEGRDSSAVEEINTILKYSIDSGASDIHIEHAGEYTRVRIREDGELKEIAAFGKTMHPMIIARVKILAGMRLDEKRKPQDGRFSVLLGSHKIDFRVSTMPGYYGEKVVMRILDSYRGIRKLEDIGFSVVHLEQIRNALKKPYGMVLISGPTGSGKTTTLYSMLNEIDRKSKNVVSLEDPIEYNVPSMNQSQVFPEIGYTFASGLRSILRQDPDVIMVGEIRDAETAQLAVQAALTGHLVFSTIHTNNSVGVITRLMDMDVDPFLIAPTLILAIAQRLTRHIIDGAADPILNNPGVEKLVETQFADLPLEYKEKLNISRPMNNPKATVDNPTGMKGRVPVLEILEVDKDIQKAIIEKKTEEEIWKIARIKGMITMREDAMMKSMDGIIPFVEIGNL